MLEIYIDTYIILLIKANCSELKYIRNLKSLKQTLMHIMYLSKLAEQRPNIPKWDIYMHLRRDQHLLIIVISPRVPPLGDDRLSHSLTHTYALQSTHGEHFCCMLKCTCIYLMHLVTLALLT